MEKKKTTYGMDDVYLIRDIEERENIFKREKSSEISWTLL